jgi:hypothetical protein
MLLEHKLFLLIKQESMKFGASGHLCLYRFLFRDGYNVSILPGLRDMTVAIRGVQNWFDWKREKIRVLLQNPINIWTFNFNCLLLFYKRGNNRWHAHLLWANDSANLPNSRKKTLTPPPPTRRGLALFKFIYEHIYALIRLARKTGLEIVSQTHALFHLESI